ncbi:hypothetical protein JTE90_017516 [Oedothorax gibbosus]|uniref:Carboxypeptidase n=1 Tax=Oedothorax gibbosus TaxID=931172 RepID=A0AAV6UB50_9ARAC|nr:hypothetical protein JTE90_017516 [Oedothorax gibbosus]
MKNSPFKNGKPLFILLCVVLTKLAGTDGISSHTGKPLFLTPYIENGDIETGRTLSRVGQLPNATSSVTSYSGFITVNKEYNSNTFFWFFPAMNNNISAPIILWLEGGPGTSSLFGMFVINGPYMMHSDMTVGLRNHTWAKEFSVLYVDNPVGAGFSFTDNENGYATGQDQIANDLYTFLQQFFKVYNEYSKNDFYVCGESYGGQYVSHLGYKLYNDGLPAEINFKGICVGNGYYNVRQFISQKEELLYQLGVVDLKQAASMKKIYDDMTNYLDKGEPYLAEKEFEKYFDVLITYSGYDFFYNILFTEDPKEFSYYVDYVRTEKVKKAIHVGHRKYRDSSNAVKHHLKLDLVVSTSTAQIASLANNYKVLIYNGQFDLVCPYVSAERFLLNNVTWKHSDEYRNTERKIWRLKDKNDVAGYVRNYGNLFGILVKNAGHMAPYDQPEAALDLITRFIKNIPYA